MQKYVAGFVLLLVGATVVLATTNDVAPVPVDATGLHDSLDVIDCTGEGACRRHPINETVTGCMEWYPSMPLEELRCNYTTTDAEEVTFIADAANYITAPFADVNYSTEIVTMGLQKPWDLEFLPDGSMLITQNDGVLYRYNEAREVVGRFDVVDDSLGGLMGLAIHPDYPEQPYIYLMYTYGYDNTLGREDYYFLNRVSRFQYQDGELGEEAVLLDALPGNVYHNGGRLEFGPDGMLYVTTGDGGRPAQSQEVSYLGGKVLRLRPNGSIPADNPFNNSPVYSLGHRNPQGIAWDPVSGALYETEHGPWRYDELNAVDAGANYGWGTAKCRELLGDTVEFTAPGQDVDDEDAAPAGRPGETGWIPPLRCFSNWTLAPSGMTFVDDPGHPWHGTLFAAGLRGRQVHRFMFEDGEIVADDIFFVNQEDPQINGLGRRLRDVEYHDGSLWVLGDWSGIAVLTPGSNT